MLIIVVALLIFLGATLLVFSERCAQKIGAFYRNYPLARLAPDRQFNLHSNYVKALGITIIIIGIALAFLN